MDPASSIIYVAVAEHKAPALPIRLLPFLPLAWFVLEVVVLIEVGQAVCALAVVALLFAAAILGWLILRHVGTSVVASMLARDSAGRPAIERLRSAGWQAAAGVLLIVPGFASDVLALLLFLPPVRRLLAGLLPKPTQVHGQRVVIEGEFQDLTPDPEPDDAYPPVAGPAGSPRRPGRGPGSQAPGEEVPGDGNPWSRRDGD
jgi:UPF0716 protein FxsA